MLELKNVSLRYSDLRVLRDVSLRLDPGERIAVMGPSGCGKTSLLRVIAGLQSPDSGTVERTAQRLSFVFQEPRLLPWRTAAENVNAVLSDRAQTMPQALAWLERLELRAARDQYPAALSGGMQQRVAIARALAYGAPVLLLGAGQDPRARHARRGRRRRARLRGVCVCRRRVPPRRMR